MFHRAGTTTEKAGLRIPVCNSFTDRTCSVSLLLGLRGQADVASGGVPQVTQPCSTKSFKVQNQHTEFNPESNWQAMQLTEQNCYIHCSSSTPNCPYHCILYYLKLPNTLQGKSHVDHIAIVYWEGDQGMSDCEESLPAQKQVKLAHNMKLCKGLPR